LSERGPWSILQDICGNELEGLAARALRSVPNFAQACMDSFHNVQPILFDFPWGEWVDEANKPYVPNPFPKSKAKPLSEAQILDLIGAERAAARRAAPQRIVRMEPFVAGDWQGQINVAGAQRVRNNEEI